MLVADAEVRTPDVATRKQDKAEETGIHVTSNAFANSGIERFLASGEFLFCTGEPKSHAYRVESGQVRASWRHPAAGSRTVACYFSGDVVGLGALDKHVMTFQASADTVVRCLPRANLADLMIADPGLAARHADATDVELALLREQLVAEGRARSLERVAALLSVLATHSGYEGRDPNIIDDDFTCGFVADQLGLRVDALAEALVGLGRLGLIEPLPNGSLRLRDRAALERLAEGGP